MWLSITAFLSFFLLLPVYSGVCDVEKGGRRRREEWAVWLFEGLILLHQWRDASSYFQTHQRGEDLSPPLPFSISNLCQSCSVYSPPHPSILLPPSLWIKIPNVCNLCHHRFCLILAISFSPCLNICSGVDHCLIFSPTSLWRSPLIFNQWPTSLLPFSLFLLAAMNQDLYPQFSLLWVCVCEVCEKAYAPPD